MRSSKSRSFPARAENVAPARSSRGGTRCNAALTVVSTTAGPQVGFVRRASTLRDASRWLAISARGEVRS